VLGLFNLTFQCKNICTLVTSTLTFCAQICVLRPLNVKHREKFIIILKLLIGNMCTGLIRYRTETTVIPLGFAVLTAVSSVQFSLSHGRRLVDQFVLVSGSPLGPMTRFYPYPFNSYNCFVFLPVGRPL
jgi:hypothetical protein